MSIHTNADPDLDGLAVALIHNLHQGLHHELLVALSKSITRRLHDSIPYHNILSWQGRPGGSCTAEAAGCRQVEVGGVGRGKKLAIYVGCSGMW